jgi:isopenicillin-N N-acyltransferase like protein
LAPADCVQAGIVGKIGFNSAGVGVCLNAIRAKPVDSSKLPVHVALRVCLDSRTKEEAFSRVTDLGGVASAQHILIADAQGPISWEVSPKGDVQIQPDEDGLVCHTNHMIQNKFMNEPPWLSGSPVRLQRIRELSKKLEQSEQRWSGQSLRDRVFSDTYNAPQAICCQEDPSRPIETRSSTLFNIIMKFGPDHPAAEVVWGRPASGEEGEVISMPW